MKTGIVAQLSVVLLAVAGLVVSSGCPSAGPGGGSGGTGATGADTNDVLAGQVSSLAGKPISESEWMDFRVVRHSLLRDLDIQHLARRRDAS